MTMRLRRVFPLIQTHAPEDALAQMRQLHPGTGPLRPVSAGRWSYSSTRAAFDGVIFGSTRASAFTSTGAGDYTGLRVKLVLRGTYSGRRGSEARVTDQRNGFNVMPPESAASVSNGYESLALRMPHDRLATSLAALECDADPLRFAERHWGQAALPGVAQFRASFLQCIRQCEEGGAALVALPSFRSAHAELLGLHLANILAQTAAGDVSFSRLPAAALGRCLAYVEHHKRGPISLVALAADAGVSLRTVQAYFARELGTTLTAYIRDARLDSVRARLAAPDVRDTVTSVALEEGFGHLGEFGRAYLARFGERPSDTLRGARRAA